MKLLRYGPPGQEKPGLLDADGRVRDLSAHVKDIFADGLSQEALAKLQALDARSLPEVTGSPRLGVPVAGIRQVVAIGLNYRQHAIESNMPIPAEPVVFFKAITSVGGPNDPIQIPEHSEAVDWEVELAVVIGKTARRVQEGEALDFVAGYTICNDVSEREWQLNKGGTWDKGKGFDTFCPLGPWLVTKDEGARSAGARARAHGERRAAPEIEHLGHDLQREAADRVLLALHDAAAGRRDHHRHAAGRGLGDEAAQDAQGRRPRARRD